MVAEEPAPVTCRAEAKIAVVFTCNARGLPSRYRVPVSLCQLALPILLISVAAAFVTTNHSENVLALLSIETVLDIWAFF